MLWAHKPLGRHLQSLGSVVGEKEEGACLPLYVLMIKCLALSVCHRSWQQRGEHFQVLQERRKNEAKLERVFVLQFWKSSHQNEDILPF